jgi:hypothetical protein
MDAKAMTDAELLAELEKASDIQVELAALHAELKRRFGACYMARHLNELREEKARREAAESFQPGDRVCHKSVVWGINWMPQTIGDGGDGGQGRFGRLHLGRRRRRVPRPGVPRLRVAEGGLRAGKARPAVTPIRESSGGGISGPGRVCACDRIIHSN